jgi:hypothetical protein
MMPTAAERGERKFTACIRTPQAGFDGLTRYLGDRNTATPCLALRAAARLSGKLIVVRLIRAY